jgi:DNA topoisomerase-1
MFPTDLGLVVTDFLKQNFEDIMDYGFTARIENEFDEVAEGKILWNDMIDGFYNPFKTDVEKTIENAERIKGEKELGAEPGTGKPVFARMGRFGPMVQIGGADEDDTPRFASLQKGQSIETITLEEALELFKLPVTLGDYEDKEVSVNAGRFGPYIKWGDSFVSLPKGQDPLTVDLTKAIKLIEEKQKAEAPIGNYEGKPVTKGKGRFGPFIKWNEMFINVPKRYDFDHLSQTEIEELILAKIDKEANRYIQQWSDEKISIENGRWGPYIRFGKKMVKMGRKDSGEKYTAEELTGIALDEVKKMIEVELPDAFKKPAKKAAAKKKAPAKKKA